MITNKSFDKVAKTKRMRMAVVKQICIQKEIKVRLNLENACYYSVQNFLSSHLVSKNLNIRIYATIILLVSCECQTWTFRVRKEHRLGVMNTVLRITFDGRLEKAA
jgi:hypothetical protein